MLEGEERDARLVQADLIAAVAEDDADRVAALLAAGANLHGTNDDVRLLHIAVRAGSARVTGALLDAGLDPNVGATGPLYPLRAEWSGQDIRLDPNVGATKPLHVAARSESPEVAALLLERGAEVDARDAIGWTPLYYALLRGVDRPAFRTANLLLEQGANANAATAAMGWTPLHLAAYLSDSGVEVLDIVQTLIERGADVGARMRIGGWSPARVAKARGRTRARARP